MKAMEHFCKECHNNVNDGEISKVLIVYEKYCRRLWEDHREVQKINQTDSNVLDKILFTPFINLYDVLLFFSYVRKNHQRGRELSNAIRKEGFSIVDPKEKKHAEMKILEANDYNVKTFTEGTWNGWRAVVTRNFCLECGTVCCACTEEKTERDLLTRDFGGSGILYKNGKVPGVGQQLIPERHQQIEDNYRELVTEHITAMMKNNGHLQVNDEKQLDKEVEEITGVREVAVSNRNPENQNWEDQKQELRNREVIMEAIKAETWGLRGS